ncbi:F-box protein SKIP23-like [Cornus florida]|uniref:F-box protein SKIP23-like n=1 Tax=Cornus florida TaxID=4283 RepID=UPI00289DE1FF|nr:F-box protein SKIP23-like [Cornus florida]
MAADWTELPPELLETIAGKLTILIDYIRCRAVCVKWRSSIPRTPLHLPCQLPWLMLPPPRTHQTHRRSFFNLSTNKTHRLDLPEIPYHRRRCGSSHGWLVFLHESPEIYLLNPFTRSKIHLPPLSTFPNVIGFNFSDIGREYSLRSPAGVVYTCNLKDMRNNFIKKVILSSSPSNDSDFVALAILNRTGDLAFCKKGDKSWRCIEGSESYCEDVIYYNGLFYAVDKYGAIAICDVCGPSPRVSIMDTPPQFGGDMQYLVRSMNQFLLVTRYLDTEYDEDLFEIFVYKTVLFKVYRLNLSNSNWEEVTNLGDQMLFLGENSSFALSASDFPGCEGNCIYYTDDYSESNYDDAPWDHDLGIYNLEDGTIETFPCYHSPSGWPPPIWITPNAC